MPVEPNIAEAIAAARRLLSSLVPCRHSKDYRSVVWFGTPYYFTALQASIIRQLWEAWENGTPELAGETLLDDAGADRAEVRIDQVFRNSSAWNTMLVSGSSKGSYRLADPEPPSA